jgi:hypothetical protein
MIILYTSPLEVQQALAQLVLVVLVQALGLCL